ncbi:MAG: glycosyltransferase family protein [Bacteroidota bacterium]
MKVLYAIQGTGNGHLSRARDLIPILQKHCELDLLVSGTQSQVKLPYPIKYQYRGLSFLHNNRGGIAYGKTAWEGFIRSRIFKQISSFPVKQYDLVINDFEPVSAWSAKMKGVRCVAIGHQASFLSEKTPRPGKRDFLGELILNRYAPSSDAIGFHFESYDEFIHTPVVRQQVRELSPTDKGHYTVYLPALSDKRLLKVLHQIPEVKWEVFSRHTQYSYREKNVWVHPVSNEGFVSSMATSTGVLAGAGFETPAEALFLGKKLFVIPARGQYEQHCNAAALAKMGVPVMWRINSTFPERLKMWVDSYWDVQIDYPEETEEIILSILEKYQDAEKPVKQRRGIRFRRKKKHKDTARIKMLL